ncbi:MAG: isoprenylcysteine carboxylmethyltransferase family protein [Isosphaeraceae bacterium]
MAFRRVLDEAALRAAARRRAKRAFRGLFQFMIALGLLLFVPAWSLEYWQAWVLLVLVGVSCLVITLYLLKHDPALVERRMEVGPVAEQDQTQRRIQTVASVLSCALLVVPALDHRLHWSHVPLWAVILGDAVLALGFLLAFFVFRENSHAAGTVKVEAGQKVITTGPYRVIRHPFYAATVLTFLAIPLALGSWWGLAVSLLILIVLAIRLIHEERFLSEHLEGYAAYCREVRYRIIPMVW